MLASFDRSAHADRLRREEFDVAVIGGGITGAGVALDAAARGLRTVLVERDDFASGTSSKSSKLVHGGLRYLQQREFRLVYEALAERQRLRRTAPHLVRLLPFLIPMFGKAGMVNKSVAKAYSSALWMYDLTGGARIGRLHQRISVEEALGHMPTLRSESLAAGFIYWDATADDARLTLTLARTAAVRFGAVVVNHAGARGLSKDSDGRVAGVVVDLDGEEVTVPARVVVNATGVWADEVRALDEGHHPGTLRPAKGVHLTVPWAKVRNDIAAVVPVKGDRRSVFVVPWGDRTYVGTTDTDHDGSLDDPVCSPADVDYLLGALNQVLAEPLSPADVLGTWAGLRPLVAAAGSDRTADLSRRHRVAVSTSGLVTVTGGKLTTYRRMAADTVDEAVRALGHRPRGRRASPTKGIPLLGAEGHDDLADPDLGAGGGLGADPGGTAPGDADADEGTRRHLAARYGGEAHAVLAMADGDPALRAPLVPGLPYLRAEALYAVRYEMARDLHDVLDRRTRARLLARDATAAAALDVARLIGPDLGWDDAESTRRAADYRAQLEAERTAAGLPETALDVALGP